MKTETINERREAGYFPYYKLQWYDPTTLAWMDVQRRFPTPAQAATVGQSLVPRDRRQQLRVMEVDRSGRRPWQPPIQPTGPTHRRRTRMGKATIHFGKDWKDKLPEGTPYLPKLSRGVQDIEDGVAVMDFYGRRYSLKPTKGAKGEYDVVADLGAAVRQPRGGRGPRATQDGPTGPEVPPGAAEAPKGRQRARTGRIPPASPGRPRSTAPKAKGGRGKPAATNGRKATGGQGRRSASTSTGKSAAAPASPQTAAPEPAAV